MINAQTIRNKFLDFFKTKGHSIIPGASLIPENDPTVLFTTAGMHPLVPYLLGEKHPAGTRLADVQKCIRTGDIDEVGDKTHLTCFEMLGNWSLGDYFKDDSIAWSWEFLTEEKWLNLDKNRLAVSVFEGDENVPFDQESYDLWLKIGVKSERIVRLGKADNWWGPAGQTGPCGPDTEIFYWTGSEAAPEVYNPEDKRWVEIWNNVFMAYNKTIDGKFEPLSQKNVDTGMGLERILCMVNNINDVYATDLFSDAIKKIAELSGKTYSDNEKAFRIVADHIKAATMIIGDPKGVSPSNTDQGYVVRKLIRRAVRFSLMLEINSKIDITTELANIYIDNNKEQYPELEKNKDYILRELKKEEYKFKETLEKGLRIFAKVTENLSDKLIPAVSAFDLYQTYGFPLEMTLELAKERGFEVDAKGFEEELVKHQELSRTASAGKFKGGLADNSEETTKLHTATHLLLAALRTVLGDHVYQKGSNITADRLRLDFSHAQKMTDEEKQKVEDLVNHAIKAELPIICQLTSLDVAKKSGAMGVFDSKYQDQVKVYTVGQGDQIFSSEICGGPHVDNTKELKSFKILKEEASSAGVRRIKAIIG
ncbi:MAG: alanine--tRNA ligase [Patescibacteria group bacterium]|nr:alanine--tRNA ligase [Patescibacteria group bacterium]